METLTKMAIAMAITMATLIAVYVIAVALTHTWRGYWKRREDEKFKKLISQSRELHIFRQEDQQAIEQAWQEKEEKTRGQTPRQR